jgi:UDP-4-amino-4,6-dideoxy-N-acetyl-beta-L-altrosamine N-acetyltransferase
MSVSLRPLVAADAQMVLHWRNSPAVAPYMYTDHLITPEEHARWVETALSATDRWTWIIEAADGAAGLVTLRRVDRDARRYDWAFYIAHEGLRGQGAGASVEFIVLEFVFAGLGARKLWCEVLENNEGVWRLHQSFGFVREALFRAHVVKAGIPRNVVGLGLLDVDWAAVRGACAARLEAKGRLGTPLGPPDRP